MVHRSESWGMGGGSAVQWGVACPGRTHSRRPAAPGPPLRWWSAWTALRASASQGKDAKETFALLDEDNSGYLDRQEVEKVTAARRPLRGD